MTIAEITLSNKEKFALEISRIKRNHNLNTIDAIVFFCEENECDIMDIIPVIDVRLKEEMWNVAIENRYILEKKQPSLF
jgi:hypothetical protein